MKCLRIPVTVPWNFILGSKKPAFPLNTILWQTGRWLVYNVSRLNLSKLFHMRAGGTVTNTEQSNVPPPPPHTQCFGSLRKKRSCFTLKNSQTAACYLKDFQDTVVYNGLLDSEGEGEGGMIWENGILTCILSCKNWIASLCLTQGAACLGLVHGDDPERCCGEGGGRGVHVWERM